MTPRRRGGPATFGADALAFFQECSAPPPDAVAAQAAAQPPAAGRGFGGTALKSYMPGRALWTSNSQVYVGGNDGAVYAFGFALERK